MTKRTAALAAAAATKRARTASLSTAAVAAVSPPPEIKPELPATPPRRRVKKEDPDPQSLEQPSPSPSKVKQSTSERKVAAYRASIQGSPFPTHPLPTPEEAERVAWILGRHHGYTPETEGGRGLPQYRPPREDVEKWGGCGDVASVLEATVRTVLSCNTSNRNSAAAHKSLTEHFGRNNWEAILNAKESEVVDAIRCGGLANNKARTIQGILRETQARHGKLSLDHLHSATDDEIMQELVSFNGVGPKVASCVLAFCIGRESMAVDTHVFRLSKALGWVPEKANRDQTYYHLHERVPGHLKYPLHVLLIKHGKTCDNCSAKGFATVKEEVEGDRIKKEDPDEDPDDDVKPALSKRPCPLKAAGLLGRKGKALRPVTKEEDDTGPVVKKEENGIKPDPEAPTPFSYARALELAQRMTADDLLKLVQKERGTRSKNPISDSLKKMGYTFEIAYASALSTEQRKRVFAIFETNMKAMYRNSTLGWKPAEKKRELFDTSSRFLIIRPPNVGAEIAAFAMWRFDTEVCSTKDPTARPGEEKVEVAYLYEIQVTPDAQRHHIGSELMDILHLIAQRTQMRKVMLTVFAENKNARAFYDRHGFAVDPVSPSLSEEPGNRYDFDIMYKVAAPTVPPST